MRAAAQFALALLLYSPFVSAQTNNAEPAVVSVEALEYGAALEEQAGDALLDWANEFVEDELRWNPPDVDGTVDAVDDAFPSRNSSTRDAVVYLVMYLAYEDQRELEGSFSRQLREYAREAEDLQEDMERWRRYGVPPASIAARPPATVSRAQEMDRGFARLRELETKSQLRKNQLREIRRRVNFYLKVLNLVHPRFENLPPETLATVSPTAPPPH